MSELIIVEGQDCLNYISKDIGFIDTNYGTSYENLQNQNYAEYQGMDFIKHGQTFGHTFGGSYKAFCNVIKWSNDKTKRIIGVIDKKYDDGGLCVKVYTNGQPFNLSTHKHYRQTVDLYAKIMYQNGGPVAGNWEKVDDDFNFYPAYTNTSPSDTNNYGCVYCEPTGTLPYVSFDDSLDYNPSEAIDTSELHISYEPTVQFDDGYTWEEGHTVTLENPLIFGRGVENVFNFQIVPWNSENPIKYLAGDLYGAMCDFTRNFYSVMPNVFTDIDDMNYFEFSYGSLVGSYNLAGIPFNIILTENKQFALDYINNGTLPPDAILYPLDWENLPKYDENIPTGDEPEDYPEDDDPDDDIRDFDDTPPETPSFTINQLTNYNWYWLDVSQWSDFISWFWNDIGDFHDFDDIIAKIEGLYNNVASAVIMCRYFPVEYEWITNKSIQNAPTENIKLGMIEKAGAVTVIDQEYPLRVQDIGHVTIDSKYNSFMDMSPYSQLSLYLPWHGFIDLDINLVSGHDLYVKALYDYLSGTIQYYIYYDNKVLVNTVLCKMAMDIPITLQTKNDRDSAIFSNVSSTVGGLVGAGAGVLSGNPIGMVMGISQGVGALSGSNTSAPMRLMGNVGESGAYLGFQQCFVVIRRPTIQPSDGNNQTSIKKGLATWKHNVGRLCGYGYTLSSLKGKGFTVCHTPRIDFKKSVPLQQEIDEIYNYLSKGVIL